jgi:hypothetical protein
MSRHQAQPISPQSYQYSNSCYALAIRFTPHHTTQNPSTLAPDFHALDWWDLDCRHHADCCRWVGAGTGIGTAQHFTHTYTHTHFNVTKSAKPLVIRPHCTITSHSLPSPGVAYRVKGPRFWAADASIRAVGVNTVVVAVAIIAGFE